MLGSTSEGRSWGSEVGRGSSGDVGFASAGGVGLFTNEKVHI